MAAITSPGTSSVSIIDVGSLVNRAFRICLRLDTILITYANKREEIAHTCKTEKTAPIATMAIPAPLGSISANRSTFSLVSSVKLLVLGVTFLMIVHSGTPSTGQPQLTSAANTGTVTLSIRLRPSALNKYNVLVFAESKVKFT